MLILLILAAYFTISAAIFINKNQIVKAKITKVEFIEVSDSDSTDWYRLDMQILPANKTINNYYFETGLTDPEFKAGQIVELYYDEKDPLNSEIKNFWVQWGPSLLIVMILAFYILVMLVISIVINKKKKKSEGSMIVSE
jgi:hypothetical protein